jgi:Flagellar assembly protein FliH
MVRPLFKHIGKADGSAHFEDVSAKLEVLPAWLDPGTLMLRDPTVVSLRPPRIPGGMGSSDGELESVPPSVIANDTWDYSFTSEPDVAAAPPPPPPPKAPSIPPPPKRPDTLFDELIPRADEEAVHAIQEAVSNLVNARSAMLRDSEREVIELARVVAERVIARELSIDPRIIQNLVREGLSALSAGDRVHVRLGPFYQDVQDEVAAAVARTGVKALIEIDSSLGAYGCTIETDWGSVDESIEMRLRTMLERLSIIPPAPKSPAAEASNYKSRK